MPHFGSLVSNEPLGPSTVFCFPPLSSADHPFMDLVCLALEPPPEGAVPLSCYPLGCDSSSVSVTPAQVTCLYQEVFTKGQVRAVYTLQVKDILDRNTLSRRNYEKQTL